MWHFIFHKLTSSWQLKTSYKLTQFLKIDERDLKEEFILPRNVYLLKEQEKTVPNEN